jgi:hypothetical protein
MEHIFNEITIPKHYFNKSLLKDLKYDLKYDLWDYLYQNLYDENNIFTEDLKITLTNNGEFI